MNQATNLIQWKNLTEEQRVDFDFENYNYSHQFFDNQTYWGDHDGKYHVDPVAVYRLKIEPEKWYFFERQGKSNIVTGKLIVNPGDAEILMPARPFEIPKQETLEDKIKAKWPDKEVAIIKSERSLIKERALLQIYGHMSHVGAQSIKGFYRYVYIHLDGDFDTSTDPAMMWAKDVTLQPVAVLFEGGGK